MNQSALKKEKKVHKTLFLFQQSSPYHNDFILKKINDLEENSPMSFSNIDELQKFYQTHESSISVLNIHDLNESKHFLETAQKLSHFLKTGKHRILLSIENLDEKLIAKFSKIRYLEVIPKSLTTQFLLSKLERHLKFIHGMEEEKNSNTSRYIQVIKSLPDIYETWVLSPHHPVQKILTYWTLHMYGPTPDEGRWLVAGEQLWKWIFKDTQSTELKHGFWYYRGQRPEFESGHWVFHGTSPLLFFGQLDRMEAIKFQCTHKNESIEVAKNKKQTENFWNHSKNPPSSTKNLTGDKKNLFNAITEPKEIDLYFKEAKTGKCEADIWLSGNSTPQLGVAVDFDKKNSLFAIDMKSKLQTDRLFEQLDTRHESHVYISLKYQRGRVFFRTGVIGRVQNKVTLLAPNKIFEIQRRINFRYELLPHERIPMNFKYGMDTEILTTGVIKNISSGGCAALVPVEKQLDFHLGLGLKNIVFEINGKKMTTQGVLRHMELFHSQEEKKSYLFIGIQFTSLPPNQIQFLDFYVFEKCREYFLSWL